MFTRRRQDTDGDKGRKEWEGYISLRQLFFVVLLHARSIFLVSGDSRRFHQDFSHISGFGKAVSPLCVCVGVCVYMCACRLFISHLPAIVLIAFELADVIQSQNKTQRRAALMRALHHIKYETEKHTGRL